MTGTAAYWWEIGPDDLVAVDLPDEQRSLLIRALIQWGGPTRPTDTLARAMGFVSRASIWPEAIRIRAALTEDEPMSKRDWARALVATEFAFASSYYGFASSYYGAAGDWEITGWSDEHTLSVLRALQHSLRGLRAPSQHGDGSEQDALAV